MPTLIEQPQVILAAGNKPKRIEEYAGLVSSGHENVSIARMLSPGGWEEPAQQPEFDEISLVLRGILRVETEAGAIDVRAGQAVIAHAGERVRYSTPGDDGADRYAFPLPCDPPLPRRHGQSARRRQALHPGQRRLLTVAFGYPPLV